MSTLELNVHCEAVLPQSLAEDLIHHCLNAVLEQQKQSGVVEVSLSFMDEAAMADINHEYRGKDKSTNVLSFPMDMPVEISPRLLGDLIFCEAVIEREAVEQGKNVEAHWAHMFVHGCFHLLGFDHIDDIEAEQMEGLEIRVLDTLGFTNPYQRTDA